MGGSRSAPESRVNRQRANRALLEAIAAVWDLVPDQRFGQFVMNLSRDPRGGFQDTWEWKHGRWHERLDVAYRTWASTARYEDFDTGDSGALPDSVVAACPPPEEEK